MAHQGPLCKCCGKPVPKKIIWKSWARASDDPPKSKAEAAARFSNYQMVSAKLHSYGDMKDQFVFSASFWDGESYEWGGHFHAQGCAARFGLGMAEKFPAYSMPAYKEALVEQAHKAVMAGKKKEEEAA